MVGVLFRPFLLTIEPSPEGSPASNWRALRDDEAGAGRKAIRAPTRSRLSLKGAASYRSAVRGRLGQLRGPGESYSDVILRLAKEG